MKVFRRKNIEHTIKVGSYTIDGDLTKAELDRIEELHPGVKELLVEVEVSEPKAEVKSAKDKV